MTYPLAAVSMSMFRGDGSWEEGGSPVNLEREVLENAIGDYVKLGETLGCEIYDDSRSAENAIIHISPLQADTTNFR